MSLNINNNDGNDIPSKNTSSDSNYKINKLNLSFQEFIDCNKINIDKLVVDKFWHSIEDDNIWIYIDENIAEWTGLLAKDGSFTDIYKSVKKHLKDDEYKIYDNFSDFKDEFIIKFYQVYKPDEQEQYKRGNKSKYLIVKPSAFKKWMMRIATSKGEEVCEYYIKLESLFKKYLLYQSKCKDIKNQQNQIQYQQQLLKLEQDNKQLEQSQQELIIIKEKEKQNLISIIKSQSEYINKLKHNNHCLDKQYFYILTNKQLSNNGYFKCGITNDKHKRLQSYRTSFPDTDEHRPFYTNTYSDIPATNIYEKYIGDLLSNFKDVKRREYIKIRYPLLKELIETSMQTHIQLCAVINNEISYLESNIDKETNWNETIQIPEYPRHTQQYAQQHTQQHTQHTQQQHQQYKSNPTTNNNNNTSDTSNTNNNSNIIQPKIIINGLSITTTITPENKHICEEYLKNLTKNDVIHITKSAIIKNKQLFEIIGSVNLPDIVDQLSKVIFEQLTKKIVYNRNVYPKKQR